MEPYVGLHMYKLNRFLCNLHSSYSLTQASTYLKWIGRQAPASEVTGGHTLPFLKGHGWPILKWYGMSSCDLWGRSLTAKIHFKFVDACVKLEKTPTLVDFPAKFDFQIFSTQKVLSEYTKLLQSLGEMGPSFLSSVMMAPLPRPLERVIVNS
jgi:hypothetical protein